MQNHLTVHAAPSAPLRTRYLSVMAWLFGVFNAARLVSYLPTLWVIGSVGDSGQHSLLTWLIWTGANLTMAAWLYEQEGHRVTRSVAVNACNSAMCMTTTVLIAVLRF